MGIPIIGDIIDAAKDIVSEVVVDKDKRMEVNLELDKIRDAALARDSQERIAQIDLNKAEANHRSIFVAGWRPAVGWVGATAFAYSAILHPITSWVARINGYTGELPVLDNSLLLTIMTGMLGMGVMRSYDKMKGTSNDVFKLSAPVSQPCEPVPEPLDSPIVASTRRPIAWGAKVSSTFRDRVWWIADELSLDPDDLMSCMAWESGESFAPDKKNMAGSGATGLIQFMPSTAVQLGTTTTKLARMTAEDQLNYVYKYFLPYKGRLNNLGDIYMAILWPKGVGQPDSYVLWDKGKMPTTFRQNAGLDTNKNGQVTRAECLKKIQEKLTKGRKPGYIG